MDHRCPWEKVRVYKTFLKFFVPPPPNKDVKHQICKRLNSWKISGLPSMTFNVLNGEIRQFVLTNHRLDYDDSSRLGSILQGLSGQFLQYLEIVNCVFDYPFQPDFHPKCKLSTLILAGMLIWIFCFSSLFSEIDFFQFLRGTKKLKSNVFVQTL